MLTTLPGGLTVFAEKNAAAPVVAIQVWVKVGGADELPGEAGIAHLHEHMLFKGTRRRGPGEIARAVEAAGGEINAWTSFDQTVYHVTIASRFWKTGLDVLADAVTQAAFDPGELRREIEVVCEEIKRAEDQPSRQASQALFSAAYQRHPYGKPVLGTPESVRGHSRESIVGFYRRWYRPENMVLVALGDLEPEELLAEARARFVWPDPTGLHAAGAATSLPPRPVRPAEPRPERPRAVLARQPIKEAHLALGWPAPSLAHPDAAALDALSLVLGHGEASRLHGALRRDRLLVTHLSASAYTPGDPGLTIVGLTLPGENVRDALAEAVRVVHRLRTDEVTDVELELACRLLESDAVYQRETVQGQARKVGYYLAAAGGLEEEERYFARLAALTPATVREAAFRWLEPRAIVCAAQLPEEASPGFDAAALEQLLEDLAAEAGEKTEPPPRPQLSRPPPVRPAVRLGSSRAGELLREELPGGGVLLLREERTVPLVAMRVAWEGGQRAEEESTAGVHTLLSRLATKGTAKRSAIEIARTMEALGGGAGGISGRNSFGLRAEALSRHFDAAFDLLAELVTEPAFPEAEVARERKLQLDQIRAQEDSPASVAFQLFSRLLHPAHPYRLDLLGTEASVGGLDADRLAALRGRYGAPGAIVSLVGDFDAREVREAVLSRFGGQEPAPPRLSPPLDPEPTGPRAAVRSLPKAQAHLVVGYPGSRLDAPDKPALDVLTAVLSGQGGRLFRELRDLRSLAYSVSGFSLDGVDPGSFALYIGCGPDKVAEALWCLRAEVDKLVQAPPSEGELDRARTHLIGGHAIGLQRYSARAAVAAFDECYRLGTGHSAKAPERIAAVTAEQVLAVARRLLRPQVEVVALVAPEGSAPRELVERAKLH